MKTQDLVYWLQGFFELGDLTIEATDIEQKTDQEMTLLPEHYVCILKHIELVKNYEKEKTHSFVHWLDGYLTAATNEKPSLETILKISKEVRQRVSSMFTHEIDKSYGDDTVADTRNKIHGPRRNRQSRPGYRGGDGMLFAC